MELSKQEIEKRKKELYAFMAPFVDKLGYKFSTDKKQVEFLLENEAKIEKEKGELYCPCKIHFGDEKYLNEIICPCIHFHKEEFDKEKKCWCGLFVLKEIKDAKQLHGKWGQK